MSAPHGHAHDDASPAHEHRSLLGRITTRPRVYTALQHAISLDYRAIKRRLRPFVREGLTYLDVGCGTGSLCPTVRDAGARYVGIDLDPAAVAYARERFPGGDFRALDARALASLGLRADRAIAVGLFHHLDDEGVGRAFAAMRSALVAGGRVLVIDAIPPRSAWNVIGAALRAFDNGAYVRRAAEYRRLAAEQFAVGADELFGLFPLDYVALELTAEP